MHFAKEMLEAQAILEKLGHKAIVPIDVIDCLENGELNMDWEHCQKYKDIDKDHFDKVADSDAIIVLNYPKNNITGYIGGATLMEIAIARHLNKKIFLLHELPPESELRYAFEIKYAKPIILNGDLTKIS